MFHREMNCRARSEPSGVLTLPPRALLIFTLCSQLPVFHSVDVQLHREGLPAEVVALVLDAQPVAGQVPEVNRRRARGDATPVIPQRQSLRAEGVGQPG